MLYKFILTYLFLTISVFAQDSLKTEKNFDINISKKYHDSEKPLPNSIIELKNDYRTIKIENKYIPERINSDNFKIANKHFAESDMFYIVIGSAIVLGSTAAYFKLESDKYFEKYESTGNKSYLNKTNNYDVYSGIALGALQINFGYMVYRLLTD